MGGTEGFLARKAADSGVGIMCGFWVLSWFGSWLYRETDYITDVVISVLRSISRAGCTIVRLLSVCS